MLSESLHLKKNKNGYDSKALTVRNQDKSRIKGVHSVYLGILLSKPTRIKQKSAWAEDHWLSGLQQAGHSRHGGLGFGSFLLSELLGS